MHKIVFKILFILFIIAANVSLYGQDILRGNDLSTAKVDRLTDADILKYQQQLKQAGLTEAQGEQIALSKGFPSEEIAKLRQRLESLTKPNRTTDDKLAEDNNSTKRGREEGKNDIPVEQIKINKKIFGAELFSTASTTFQPDLKIATPVNYTLGPDDQLQVSVYGMQVASFNVTVSPEGTINIPNVGEIKVSGYTFEEARSKVKGRMASIYTSLRSGASQLSINLGNIRSIRVTVLGSYKPGTYTVSSLSTVFNVLYLSGGPALNGSFREIELVRNNEIVKKIDLYKFLISASTEDDERVRENDIIRIPVYKNRVEIAGQIKRPGIFEILPDETVNDLLKFASGFTDTAYKASIKVIQLTDKEKKVKDINQDAYDLYSPRTGDFFEVSRILDRFLNRVTIEGAVFRPGIFEITSGLTIGQLINNAEGIREDAYTERAQLIRLKSDLTTEIISFNVAKVLNGITDIPLKREDKIIISSIFDLKNEFNVTIQGEVRFPGNFKYVESLTVKDLILQAGGFTDAAYPQKIEIARVIRRDTLTAQDVRLSEIIDIRDMNELASIDKNISLKPFDIITVRRLPGYLELKSVIAHGQVQYPGPYVLSSRQERVSDLLRRAGGFAPEAYPAAAFLKRINETNLKDQLDSVIVEKIQGSLHDSTKKIITDVKRPFDQIPLDMVYIITHPGSDADLILKARDELFVPRNDEAIKISGQVLSPTQSPFRKRDKVADYIGNAGGFTDDARKSKVYVLYPNGKAARTKHFLFVRSYPQIKPGSEIIVPKINIKPKKSTAEIVGVASAVAGLAAIVLGIIQLTK